MAASAIAMNAAVFIVFFIIRIENLTDKDSKKSHWP
jgi:hypothetical protein